MRYRRNSNTFFTVTLLAATVLSGCGGGTVQTTQFELSPEALSGGNRVAATETFDFSGKIRNSQFTTPRYYVQVPVDEPLYRPDQPVSGNNILHGTIDVVTGRYTAPSRLADFGNQTGNNNTDMIVVLDQTTEAELRATTAGALRAGYEQWSRSGFGEDPATGQAVREAMIATGILGDPDTVGLALSERRDPRYPNFGSYVGGALTDDILWEYLLLSGRSAPDIAAKPVINGVNYQSAVFSRLIAALDGSVRLALTDRGVEAEKRIADTPITDLVRTKKITVRLDVAHKVQVDPLTVDVSIRDRVRLDQFVKILGDQVLCDNSVGGSACRTLQNGAPDPAQAAKLMNDRVTFELENPTQGAGGGLESIPINPANPSVTKQTGTYVAPLLLSASASPRGQQDVVIIRSRADQTVVGRITVNVIVADAPTVITINDGNPPTRGVSPKSARVN